MFVVDSSVWIDLFRGNQTPQVTRLAQIVNVGPIAIGDLILAEVLQGFDSDREFEIARKALTALFVLDMCGEQTAIEAAKNYRLLRKKSITIRKTIDVIIATRCILDQLPLLYSDRDFDPFVKHLGLQSRDALNNA